MQIVNSENGICYVIDMTTFAVILETTGYIHSHHKSRKMSHH